MGNWSSLESSAYFYVCTSSTEMGTTVGKNAAKCVDVFQGLFEIHAKSAMA
jgi:hypothetical protein